MIKVIKGTIGCKVGRLHKTFTAEDGAIHLDDALEARFVRLGVAVYVNAPAQSDAEGTGGAEDIPEGVYTSEDDKTEDKPTLPAYSVDMKAEYLRNLGKQFDLNFKVGMSKAEMVEALDEYFKVEDIDEEDTEEDDGEDAPTFDSTDAVR